MRLPALLPALLAGTALAGAHDSAAATRTAAVYIQPVAAPSTAPSLLAELAIPSSSSSSTTTTTTTTGESSDDQQDPSTLVLSYSAPDLPDDAKLVRIGLYDPSAQKWLSSTSVASADNFAKGYAPHFEVTVDDEGRDVLGVLCRGVAIDAGQTRDFGPQARVVRTGRGAQPALGKPVVVRREGGKVVEEEQKTFVQKYVCVSSSSSCSLSGFLGWRLLTIGVVVGTGGRWLLGRYCCLPEGGSKSKVCRFGFGAVFGNGILFGFVIQVVFLAGEGARCAVCKGCGVSIFSISASCRHQSLLASCTRLSPCLCRRLCLPFHCPPVNTGARALTDLAVSASALRPLSAGCHWLPGRP